ncbi:SRPBCC family protein [Phytohabitans sp. ZYX-F-186]|uniref:SRPBCC family protein n=1 Tax=Phytohabitans maris TaxID=3071409 RepID=A0ABU0ZU32_9ACTN|nr:SRPBCC family protein [Phytohabitans sp. ZYX-F-186]MDQ7909680.1 SRPBCC family protein [Phytohabitans sp. ZYX-F-186]
MRLDHSFSVPVPVEEAWGVLLDVPRVAPCMPGAALTGFDGEGFTGTVKVKVGPIGLTYTGKGRFVERDEAARRVVIEASGRDTRAAGTAAATVTATLKPEGDTTRVEVSTDLTVTGKPAQFGRGMLSDVGGRLVGQFAECLATELAAPAAPPAAPAAAEPAAAIVAPETQPEAEVEPIDVLRLSMGTAAARYAGLIVISAGAAVLTWLVIRALRR